MKPQQNKLISPSTNTNSKANSNNLSSTLKKNTFSNSNKFNTINNKKKSNNNLFAKKFFESYSDNELTENEPKIIARQSSKLLKFDNKNDFMNIKRKEFIDDTSKSLRKQSIISQKEQIKETTYFFIQMELCKGDDLRKYMEDRKKEGLDQTTIFRFTYQLLKSLIEIHDHKIIHRDIKPENIFIYTRNNDNKDSIKIGDFGLAMELEKPEDNVKRSSNKLGSKALEGTPIYLSPEQLEGKHIDQKVDIYALGLVLYEMCANFNTYMERRMNIDDLKKARKINISKLTDIQRKLIRKMTEMKPSDRPTAKEIFSMPEFKAWGKSLLPSDINEIIDDIDVIGDLV